MIPTGGAVINQSVQQVEQPSRTWRIDFGKGRILGMVDGIEAVKQAAYKILQTQRYKYLAYSFNYGHELESVIGLSPLFVKSELTRIIQEALKQDDRIQRIENLQTTIAGDSITATFTVVTNFGNFDVTQEVR